MDHFETAIVGAGISGLMAATYLAEKGKNSVIFDKGRGPGGRMSTRRFGEFRLDHGAQFFTVRDPRFEKYVQGWEKAGVARIWCKGFSGTGDGHPRFRGTEGMNSIPKWLASQLDVRTGHKVKSIRFVNNLWHLDFENSQSVSADQLLMTSPVPQTIALLEAGQVELAPTTRNFLSLISYDPCISLMVIPKKPLFMPEHGGWQINEEPLQFVADNQLKGLPNPGQALTFHLGPQTSTEHWESGPERLSELVTGELRERGKDLVIEDIQIHRWRYSQPSLLHNESFLVAEGVPNLVYAGDAFAGPKIEGAALSGLSAAQYMIA